MQHPLLRIKKTEEREKAKKGNGFAWLLVLAVVIVLGLGVFAVYGTFADMAGKKADEKLSERIQSGEATVTELADAQGMNADEFIKAYNLSDEDGINADSSMTEFSEKITLKQFCEFAGISYTDFDFDMYKVQAGLGDDVTAETTDMNIKSGFASYMYEKEQQEAAQTATESGQAEE